MSEQPPEGAPATFQINLPQDHEEGHYADFASIWHNRETFVLDFIAMTHPPELIEDDQGQRLAQIKTKVVTRVRIPASQVWEVMKALEKQFTAWEIETGRRAHGADPEMPPAS